MSIDVDDEILQDFLIEAGEILEQLGEQLVDLEQQPQDKELLNAIFRGFHTVKGGAGFLNITPLVEICHRAEDVFNLLRQGEAVADATIMDVILRALDTVNEMFATVRNGDGPRPADSELLDQLRHIAEHGEAPAGEVLAPTPAAEASAIVQDLGTAAPSPGDDADLTDQEFEALVDAAADGEVESVGVAAGGEDITDEEFEALLDQLHGKGQFDGAPRTAEAAEPPAPEPAANKNEDITDDEFEVLLDELHGKGQFRGVPDADAAPAAAQAVSAKAVSRAAPASISSPRSETAAHASQQADATIRVDTRRLDDIMNMVGELVLVRNRLATLRNHINDEQVAKAVKNLDVVTADLQLAAMKTRMQPIKKVFGRFPRVVRDLARSLRKEVLLEMQGEETDLDKNLVEALADPLVHLVRNAVDHGIEDPRAREQAGKPRQGTVVLAAEQAGDHILLTIEDDGAGMDSEVLRSKAVEKGLMDSATAARLTEYECYNLIFMPGFSTKSEISDVSGRGVGMDVVKTRIGQLNGTVEIDSEPGKGSTISIKVPLTLAILPTLMVRLSNQTFAIPLANVNEIFDLDLSATKVVDGQEVVLLRERALPIFYLKEWLIRGGAGGERPEAGHVVVVHVANRMVGFVVDHLLGQEEVVIKPLGAFLQHVSGLAGATITGDGGIALILDVPSLLKAYVGK